MKRCVLIISHGSRDKSANREFKGLVQKYRLRHPDWKISLGFLELAHPSIPEALEYLVRTMKQNEILVLPLFLFTAKHVKEHIPEILRAFRKKHPSVKVKQAKPLGSDLQLLDILDRRLQQISK
jgi:sirohydrochlorin cobaltochelatase